MGPQAWHVGIGTFFLTPTFSCVRKKIKVVAVEASVMAATALKICTHTSVNGIMEETQSVEIQTSNLLLDSGKRRSVRFSSYYGGGNLSFEFKLSMAFMRIVRGRDYLNPI